MFIFSILNLFSRRAPYIKHKVRVLELCVDDILELSKCLNAAMMHMLMTARLNRLLPRIFPIHNPGLSKMSVEERLVNSSGSDVTAESRIPPMKAPDRLVVLSSRSTYSEALFDRNTMAAATVT